MQRSPDAKYTPAYSSEFILTSSSPLPVVSTILSTNPGDLQPDNDPLSHNNMNLFQSTQRNAQSSTSTTRNFLETDNTIDDIESFVQAAIQSYPLSSWDTPDGMASDLNTPDKRSEVRRDTEGVNVASLQDRISPLLELLCYSGDNDIESLLTQDVNENKFLGTKINKPNSNEESTNDDENADKLRRHANSEILALLDYNYPHRSDEENLVCFICCEAFYERLHLKNHLVNLHLRHIPISQFAGCPYCPFVGKSRYQFVDHVLKSRAACRSLMMRKKEKGRLKSKSKSNKEKQI